MAQNNLIVNLKGKGADSDLTVTGSNLTVGNNFYQSVEGDVLYQASTQTDTQDSQNSSKGWGVGVYASANLGTDGLSSNPAGFTVNANKAKGSSSETTTTHTNTQVTVGGTTVNDIGGNLILDGANLDTKHLTGTVGGDLIVNSRQDAYQYTHNQKQAGFSADVGFDGKPQSFSINGGKTDADASYKQVTKQTGITANQSTLSVQGQGKFTGGYLITDAGKNQTQFAQGIQTQDIENHLNYEGDAISVGIGIGADTSNPNGKAKPALQGIGYGKIDPVNKTSTTHAAITDQAGLSHINTENFKQEEVQHELNEIITNDFNKEQVLTELGAQVNITTEFGKEAPRRVGDYAEDKRLELLAQGNIEEAKKWAEGGIYRVALHTAVGAIGAGTIEGAVTTGSVAAAAPTIDKLSEQITEQLLKAGISEDTAQNATSLITSLAIATATQSAGVDTTSTAMAVNADAFNRQLHPDEIRFILDKDRVKRFAEKYGLSIEEAKKELAIVATAYHDLEWAEAFEKDGNKLNVLHGDQDRAFDFLYNDEDVQNYWHNSTEANSDMRLFKDDLIGKVRGDSFKNLDELMRAAAHDQTVREYIELIWVNKDPALATFEYNKGVGNAYNTANTNPIETTKLILDDFINLIPNIIKSAQSSDIGPIDSVRGAKDYERLLQLQGNYYDYGYLKTSQEIENSQKIWMTMPAAEVSALAAEKVLLGRAVKQEVDNAVNQNLPDVYGDGDLGNVLYGNPNSASDNAIAIKKQDDSTMGTHNPHYDTKHGAYTSLQAQHDRAITGISPELGIMQGRPTNASKFFNSTDMEYAIRQAEKMYAENPSKYTDSKGKISIDITFNRPIGEGFMGANNTNARLGIAGEYRWSKSATVSIDPKTGKAYTAFPNMEQGYKQDNEILKFIKQGE